MPKSRRAQEDRAAFDHGGRTRAGFAALHQQAPEPPTLPTHSQTTTTAHAAQRSPAQHLAWLRRVFGLAVFPTAFCESFAAAGDEVPDPVDQPDAGSQEFAGHR
jgi:hypothetical protein